MSARKPSSLMAYNRDTGKREEREAAEAALTPKLELSPDPPKALKGRRHARAAWRRLLALYSSAEAKIVNAFDENLLITYVKLLEEEIDLEEKVQALDKAQKDLLAKVEAIEPTAENLKEYLGLWSQFNGLTGNFLKTSARLDAKRKHRANLEQSLYLTPRSRAGVAPSEKPPEPPKDDMEKLLDEGNY